MKHKKYRTSRRTNSYMSKLLSEYETCMLLGYTHENFNNVSRCLQRASEHLFLEEIKTLERFWRDSYTDDCEQASLKEAVEEIRSRF